MKTTDVRLDTISYPPLEGDDSRERELDIAVPDGPIRNVALFYVHGGGWFAGSRESYHEHLQRSAKLGFLCASAGYRISDDTRFDDKMADVATGYGVFGQLIADRQLPVDHVVLMGSSAGAHLATMLALRGPRAWGRDADAPTACISVNGPGTLLDFDGMDEGIRASQEKLVGARYAHDPQAFEPASPERHVPADPPDFLFIVVGKEKYFPHSYVHAIADQLRSAGARAQVELFPKAEHGFFYRLDGPDQQRALTVVDNFLAPYLDEKSAQ